MLQEEGNKAQKTSMGGLILKIVLSLIIAFVFFGLGLLTGLLTA